MFLNRGSRSVDIVATKKDFISPQIISGVVKLIDFAAIVLISIGAYEVYLTEILNSYEDIGRYLITSASSALFFLIVFQWIGGYQFDRFSFLSWQLPRVVLVWFGPFSFLLTLAFTAKVSSTYSRGWAIS